MFRRAGQGGDCGGVERRRRPDEMAVEAALVTLTPVRGKRDGVVQQDGPALRGIPDPSPASREKGEQRRPEGTGEDRDGLEIPLPQPAQNSKRGKRRTIDRKFPDPADIGMDGIERRQVRARQHLDGRGCRRLRFFHAGSQRKGGKRHDDVPEPVQPDEQVAVGLRCHVPFSRRQSKNTARSRPMAAQSRSRQRQCPSGQTGRCP